MVRYKEAKKSRARSVLRRCAVWIFSLTRQIAVLGRPVKSDTSVQSVSTVARRSSLPIGKPPTHIGRDSAAPGKDTRACLVVIPAQAGIQGCPARQCDDGFPPARE